MKAALSLLLLVCLSLAVRADIYIHAPRGMNNRCDEQNNDRNNNNRLFNSQNNAAGGYAVGPPTYYYAGSILTLEWYSQHACGGNGRVNCEYILQYACDNSYKDGQSQDPTGDGGGNTCTDEITTANENNVDVGRHESASYFTNCNNRERNRGLFAAREQINANNAQGTRQNANGGTSGFECQEERDYYPYWHPSPFKDIAVLTTDTSRCNYYQAQSQNVQAKNQCSNAAFNNQQTCTTNGGIWQEQPSWRSIDGVKIKSPECEESMWGRDNTLGSSDDGYIQTFNWTIPNDVHPICFLRARYNISTADYDGWDTYSSSNGNQSPVQDDPYIMYGNMPVRLAIDTNQFGRTFEDRSYVFEIRSKLDAGLSGLISNVYNLGVRGKRGNIAQVRNCVEYDYSPERLRAARGDYVHVQFTGSNHNPAGNAGEGRNRWDRSNMMQLRNNDLGTNYPEDLATQTLFQNEDDAYRQAFIGQAPAGGCTPLATLQANNNDQDVNNCAKLNGNPTGYWDGGLHKFNRTGTFNFMSSRNNNFSNRGQKGTWIITAFNRTIFLWVVGAFLGILLLAAIAVVVVIAVAGAPGAAAIGLGFLVSGSRGGYSYKTGSYTAPTRRSAGSSRSGHSQGSHRSKGSKGSFGASMI